MRIVLREGGYNQRRYGRPWIGIVTAWPVGGRPEIRWGGYAGDDAGGELEITGDAGQIVRWGQKDGRGNGGRNEWGIAQADGTVQSCTQPEARAQWDKLQATPVAGPVSPTPVAGPLDGITDDQLIAEIRRRGLTVTQEHLV